MLMCIFQGADIIKEDWRAVMSGLGGDLPGRRGVRVRREKGGRGGGSIPPYRNTTEVGGDLLRKDGA